MDAIYRRWFPNLRDVAKKKTSDPDPIYNCVAWAFKRTRGIWWPDSKGYWPIPYNNMTVLEAFEALFASDGWQETTNATVEIGFEKIALFMRNGTPTHAARLLPDGLWTSKLGWDRYYSIDLSHGLNDLDGGSYGFVTRIYKKQTTPPSTSPPPSGQS